MRTEDFNYDLPPDRIAQRPTEPRDSSRLMVLRRDTGALEHRIFHQLPDLLRPGDVLVLNRTRVIPARLRAHKAPGGGPVEILLLKRIHAGLWEALVGGRRLSTGVKLHLDHAIEAEILEDLGGARRLIRFSRPIQAELEEIGQMPLPPYIHEPLRHPTEYQTVFARDPGSAAAPTAGLHFTPRLLSELSARAISILEITLHVGLDTFAPVTEEDPAQHTIHTEWCRVPPRAAETVNRARKSGSRIIAVGTTTVRALETAARLGEGSGAAAFEGPTDVFILPGFEFRIVDAMITNFHLPRSTLLMLVSAFAGRQQILDAYQVAVRQGYRFYSFGDAMFIV